MTIPKKSPGRPRSSRQKVENKDVVQISKTGVELEECWCRKCMCFKSVREFYDATDHYLDSNGKMSVCKGCVDELFKRTLQSEVDLYRTFLKVCRVLNIKYDESAINASLRHKETAESSGKIIDYLFSIYKNKLVVLTRPGSQHVGGKTVDLTFVEPQNYAEINPITAEDTDEVVDVKKRWGTIYSEEEYDYLETELADWMKTHKCDTKAEMTLLKEICHKSLEIRNDRVSGKPTAAKVKELQELMKTANVDPAKTAIAGGGRSQDSFSNFVKVIENEEPADYYQDKGLFKDFDNIEWYFKKFITRPLGNFLEVTKNFNLNDDEEDEEEIKTDENLFDHIKDANND
jgi:hypothetical protein